MNDPRVNFQPSFLKASFWSIFCFSYQMLVDFWRQKNLNSKMVHCRKVLTPEVTGWPLSNGPPSDKLVQFSGFFNFPLLFQCQIKKTGKSNLFLPHEYGYVVKKYGQVDQNPKVFKFYLEKVNLIWLSKKYIKVLKNFIIFS